MSEASEAVAARIARVETALGVLDGFTTEPPPASDDAPVFIASIGWRSGSTLLQRILMTDPSILIWGEPLERMLLVNQFTEAVAMVDAIWPMTSSWITNIANTDLTRDWVASLYPDPGRLRAGMRAMMDAWLAAPARDRGHARWGAKEVQWSGADGLLLRWLYPNCRFLVIARHPVSAYYSLRNFGPVPIGGAFAPRWPEKVATYEGAYGRLWNELVLSWLTVGDRLGVRVVRYEDLIGGSVDLADLGQSLGLTLDPAVALETKVGGSQYKQLITEEEKQRVNALTVEGRALLAYLE
jgi:hypothetical protein